MCWKAACAGLPSRVRINAQMIDGQTGGHLWAERYDRDLEDIFAVQDEVTRTIVTALKVQLTAGEMTERERAQEDQTPRPTIFSSAPAQTMLQLRPEAAIEARGMLERVIELGSGQALAYGRLSMITFAEFANRWNGATPDNLDARSGTRRTRRSRPTRASRRDTSRVALVLSWLRRLDEAEQSAERAIELDPNFADGYACLGNVRDIWADTRARSRSTRAPTGSTRSSTWRCISWAARSPRSAASTRRRSPSSGA